MPANAAQARIAAQILIYRELADTVATQAHASVAGSPAAGPPSPAPQPRWGRPRQCWSDR